MHRICLTVIGVVVLLFVAAAAPGQVLTRVTPQVGAPGDTVIIIGTNLGGTTNVRFGASVGGFAGFWTINTTPVSVSPTLVVATVPTFGNFLPPGVAGSSPVGTVDTGGPGFSNSLPFFYMEQTVGQLSTPGLGTTQGGLNGRPVIGFKIAMGAPNHGNSAFTLTLENAVPSSIATLVLGFPATPPLLPYLDGLVAIDLLQPIVLVQPSFVVDAIGDVMVNIPIPATNFNTIFTIQWAIVDPVTGAVGISDGMSVAL